MDHPTPAQELEMIEISLENAKAKVAMADALERLHQNKDFKLVFLDHFLGAEVARTVKLMAAPGFQSPEDQAHLNKFLIAVGQVDQFMMTTFRMGDMALQGIADDEAAIEEILEGEV